MKLLHLQDGNYCIIIRFSEPIRNLVIPTNCFQTKNYCPTLSKKHLQYLYFSLNHKINIIIRSSNEEYLDKYTEYINYVYKNIPFSYIDSQLTPFYDCLQKPLQPLQGFLLLILDNLESQTYEVFESDPVKYQFYEEAISKCKFLLII
jgi:hypothetical protein